MKTMWVVLVAVGCGGATAAEAPETQDATDASQAMADAGEVLPDADAHPEDAKRICIGYICPDATAD